MDCEDSIIISLTRHTTKIILKIIQIRIQNKTHTQAAEEQLGFVNKKKKKNSGTREALVCLRNLIERCV